MAHAAPPPPGRQKRNAIIGAIVVVVGVVLAVIAVIGLNHPKGPSAADDTTPATRTVTSSGTTSRPSTTPATRSSSSTPRTTASRTAPRTTPRATASSTASAPAGSAPLLILNNTGRPGLAALAESRFEAKGWTVSSIANYSNSDILSTCAYWDATVPGAEAAAQKLQQQFPNILRVKQRFDGLPAGPVVVVLNDDYS